MVAGGPTFSLASLARDGKGRNGSAAARDSGPRGSGRGSLATCGGADQRGWKGRGGAGGDDLAAPHRLAFQRPHPAGGRSGPCEEPHGADARTSDQHRLLSHPVHARHAAHGCDRDGDLEPEGGDLLI